MILNPTSKVKEFKGQKYSLFDFKKGMVIIEGNENNIVFDSEAICCKDGYFFDTWDSGLKCLYGYWEKN